MAASQGTIRTSATFGAAGTNADLLQNVHGALVMQNWKEWLVMNGYAFTSTGTAGPTDNETGEVGAGSMAVDELEPSFCFDVPTGTTVVPLRVMMGIEAQAATDVISVIAYDSILRFSSGGVAAVAARNLHGGSTRSSVVTNLLSGDTAITSLASSAQRQLAVYMDEFANNTGRRSGLNFDWIAPYPVRIVGPGAFLIYVHGTTGAIEFQVVVDWAEIATADLIGS